ncbi:Uncharacterised protein [Candidatus Gugararchaeum adminiculabundum]|nr:Uncharacterised protein [Candidatus Gugararchaeum adminiculabundum]
MARGVVKKTASSYLLEVPAEVFENSNVNDGDEFELLPVKDGMFVLLKESNGSANSFKLPSGKSISEAEIILLKKLDSFNFTQRVPGIVNKELNQGERQLLKQLIDKKLVTVFKSPKYKDGVYNINDSVYSLVKKKFEAPKQAQQSEPPKHFNPLQKASTPLEALERYGYVIVSSELDAKEIGAKLEKRIKAGEVMGTRAFDKKFYVAMRSFYLKMGDEVRRALSNGKVQTHSEIAKSLSLDEDACMVCLALMSADGDVIENRKGQYKMV